MTSNFSFFNLAKGFSQLETAEISKDQKYQLEALRGNLIKALALRSIDDLIDADLDEVSEKLEIHLSELKRSLGYIRNQRSVLRKVASLSPAIKRNSALCERLTEAFDATKVAISPLARDRFFSFLRRSRFSDLNWTEIIWAEILGDFAKHLEVRLGLSPWGQVQNHKSEVRQALEAIGISVYSATVKHQLVLAKSLESDLASLETVLSHNTKPLGNANASSKLKRPDGKSLKNSKRTKDKLKPATVKKTSATIRIIAKRILTAEPSLNQDGSRLADVLDYERFWVELERCHETESITTSTADTWIDCITRVLRLCAAAECCGYDRYSAAEVKELNLKFWQLSFETTSQLAKPGVAAKREKNSLPSYKTVYKSCMEELLRELKLISKTLERPTRATPEHFSLKVRKAIEAIVILNFAPRPQDLDVTLKLSDFHKDKESDLWILKFLPSKTADKNIFVHACLHQWFNPVMELYFTNFHGFLSQDTDLLLPASQRRKEVNVAVSKPGQERCGNRHNRRGQLSRKYFGTRVGANDSRKILISFFGYSGLPGCFRYTGHSPSSSGRSRLTAVEIDNYLTQSQGEIIKADIRLQRELKELVDISPDDVSKIRSTCLEIKRHLSRLTKP